MSKVHDLINYERKKRGISTVYWSREMARLAQSQANYCARVGHLVHSNRYAFRGGENLAEGGSNFSPKGIVDCWLGSKAGHREYLLSPRVQKAGVGIAKSRGKTYVAWAFSDQPPSYPDCPYFKRKRPSNMPKHYQKKSYYRRHYPLRTFVTILAVIFSVLALGAFVAFLSPTTFIKLLLYLPPDIQDAIFFDIILRGGTGLWVFVIVSAILWYIRGKIRM